MKILILNGPNLNLLGTREPEQYGHASLADVEALCKATAQPLGLEVHFVQSNHEGELIDQMHAYGQLCQQGKAIGAVFNPGAFTHTSVALHDAIKGTGLPVIETHISNVCRARSRWKRSAHASCSKSRTQLQHSLCMNLRNATLGNAQRFTYFRQC